VAVRFDAATDRISIAAAPPDPAAGITVLGWAYVSVNTGTNATMCRLHAASGASTTVTFATDGAAPAGPGYFTAGGSIVSSTQAPVGEWRRVAITCTGTSGNLYVATPAGAVDTDSGTVSGAASPTGLTLGGRSPVDGSEWFNGRLAYWRVWSAVLTPTERDAEWASTVAVRTANLWADWPLTTHTDLTDHSGNGRHLTAGSTATTTETGPPLAVEVTGTATGTGGGSGGAAGVREVVGSASGGGAGTGSATGSVEVPGTATGQGGGIGSASGVREITGTASGTGGGGGSAVGTVESVEVIATAVGRAGGDGAAVGVRELVGVGVGMGGGVGAAAGVREVAGVALGAGGGVGAVVVATDVDTPPERVFVVAAESRVFTVPAESRTWEA
jgi:hypothetical protein